MLASALQDGPVELAVQLLAFALRNALWKMLETFPSVPSCKTRYRRVSKRRIPLRPCDTSICKRTKRDCGESVVITIVKVIENRNRNRKKINGKKEM